jgi:hypothetical protein
MFLMRCRGIYVYVPDRRAKQFAHELNTTIIRALAGWMEERN